MRENHIHLGGGWRRTLAATCLIILAAAPLTACQEHGGDKGSAAAKSGSLQRFDRFQAIAGNGERLVAVGAFGAVEVSEDQGKSWVRQELAGAPGLIGLTVCGDGSFAALDFAGVVYRADKTAAAWAARKTPATDALLDITCSSGNRLWVVGARGALLSSADDGLSWKDQSLPEDIQLLNIQFPSDSMGVVSGEFGRVLVSHDGGGTWKTAGSLGESFYPYAMDFLGEKRGLATGVGGVVMETLDGGASWSQGQVPTEAPLYGVRAEPAGGALVVGAGGAAFRLSGGQWKPVAGLPPVDLRGIAKTATVTLVAGSGALVVVPAAAAN